METSLAGSKPVILTWRLRNVKEIQKCLKMQNWGHYLCKDSCQTCLFTKKYMAPMFHNNAPVFTENPLKLTCATTKSIHRGGGCVWGKWLTTCTSCPMAASFFKITWAKLKWLRAGTGNKPSTRKLLHGLFKCKNATSRYNHTYRMLERKLQNDEYWS